MYHSLLTQQVEELLPAELRGHPGLTPLLEGVDKSYRSYEQDSQLMCNAFERREEEITQINQELNTLAEQRLQTLRQLNEIIGDLPGTDRSAWEGNDLVALAERIRAQVAINKSNEEELVRHMNLFKTLLGNLNAGILIENEHRHILFTNDTFCSHFGIPATPDQLIGADCSDSASQSMHLFKDPDGFVRGIKTVLANRKPVYGEVLEMVDGRVFERDYVPIFVGEEYQGHLWDYTEVTEQARYQQSLRESEERNRLVLNSSLDAIVISDEAGRIQYWNPRAEELFKWSHEEARGQMMNDLFIPDRMRCPHLAGMRRYLDTGKSKIMNQLLEVTAVNKRGEEFPIELVVVSYQQNGKQYFCGFMKDISARKRSENLLKDQEAKYRNILANMNLGLLEVDKEENILYANQTFCEISGYTADEIIGNKTDTFLVSKEQLELIKSKQDLRALGVSDNYEIAAKSKAGETRYWLVAGAPNYNDQGELVGSIGIHLDITEQKKLESELAIAKTRAEQASAAKDAFLANMSHEIRTPLNAIIGMIRELSREELSPKQQTYLSHTDTAARHLLSIVNSILDLSKIEAGELELDNHDFSLEAVIANLKSILQVKAAKKGIELRCEMDEQVWPAHVGDSSRIRQVLLNLLDNAIKFTSEGEVGMQLSVVNEDRDRQRIRIDVTDTGIGMEEKFLGQLFAKFTQEEKSTTRRFGGTGLGMSITKEMLKLMDGSISVSSSKGVGTHFTVEVDLPRGNVDKLADSTVDSQQLLKGTHLLLVEDNLMNRFIATKSLSHFGCTVDEAENGRVALERLEENTYDLILMDIQMPELDGVETTRIIRNELNLDIPIIAVTANAFKKDIDLYLSIGMNDYVTKPFEEQVLFSTLTNQLRRSAPAPVVQADDRYDLTDLRAVSRGDEEFVENMVDIFVEHTPPALTEMCLALANTDYAAVAKIAHQIKPSIKSMGIRQLDGVALDIETSAKAEAVDAELLAAKVNLLHETLLRVIDRIRTDRMAGTRTS